MIAALYLPQGREVIKTFGLQLLKAFYKKFGLLEVKSLGKNSTITPNRLGDDGLKRAMKTTTSREPFLPLGDPGQKPLKLPRFLPVVLRVP